MLNYSILVFNSNYCMLLTSGVEVKKWGRGWYAPSLPHPLTSIGASKPNVFLLSLPLMVILGGGGRRSEVCSPPPPPLGHAACKVTSREMRKESTPIMTFHSQGPRICLRTGPSSFLSLFPKCSRERTSSGLWPSSVTDPLPPTSLSHCLPFLHTHLWVLLGKVVTLLKTEVLA